MFVRRGEALGSVRVDVDPSEAEKRLKRSAPAKKAVEARSEQRIEPGSVESVPAAIHSPGEFHAAADKPDPKPAAAEDSDKDDEPESKPTQKAAPKPGPKKGN